MNSELRNFITDLYNDAIAGNVFEGTRYHEIEELPEYLDCGPLFLVAACNEDGCIDCKIAYNCDALQCDYDFDWYMPTFDGLTDDLYDSEIQNIESFSEVSFILTIEDMIAELNELLQ